MSVAIDVRYEGDLQCTSVHGPSGARLGTDAPVDNGGKARTFSPTDLVATALGSCMLTVVAKTAAERGWPIAGARAQVEKEMTVERPRRIARLQVRLTLPASLDAHARQVIERTAHTCPVGNSLSPDTKIEVHFVYE